VTYTTPIFEAARLNCRANDDAGPSTAGGGGSGGGGGGGGSGGGGGKDVVRCIVVWRESTRRGGTGCYVDERATPAKCPLRVSAAADDGNVRYMVRIRKKPTTTGRVVRHATKTL